MLIQPTHKAILAYQKAMATYEDQDISHEMAVRLAFATLLETTARGVGWTLVMEHTLPNRKRIDGMLQDEFRLSRGYWEAKDSNDNLEREIAKKIALDYPLSNTIFEDTRQAVLYQNGQKKLVVDLTDPAQIADLLSVFLNHTEPRIEEFHTAVSTFQDRIPKLAAALVEHINTEYQQNPTFIAALDSFITLCQNAINPNISIDAIKEMLVQHLLTERLFRTIFNTSDFTNRNVIAVEIEKVIYALTSRSFSRQDFLQQLDYFYIAIEQSAATISEFSKKQAFLNTVYERFFQGFSRKQADTHGIVYTPQEIVDFMCASVDVVLEQEFGKTLSSTGVSILDPCVGTGNFIINIIHRLNRSALQHKYQYELFCNEIMLLPYYIASLNIEQAYYARATSFLPFEGICFIDTLDIDNAQKNMLSEVNTRRIKREQETNIMVVLGNPPYNAGQVNENDNNKNREYPKVDQSVRTSYAKDSHASNRNALSDMYVKFFRWATDRLNKRDGIICFVTNNGFLDGIAFDGFRKHLAQDFTRIYHLNLGGNVRRKGGGNVFDIRVGVGITLLVQKAAHTDHQIHYYQVPEAWRKEEKLAFLAETGDMRAVAWERLKPDAQHFWLTQGYRKEFAKFIPMGTPEAKSDQTQTGKVLFQTYSQGVKTNRDAWVYNYQRKALQTHVKRLIATYNSAVDLWKREGKKDTRVDDFVEYDDKKIKWSSSLKQSMQRKVYATFVAEKIRVSLYRPFCKQYLFFDRVLVERGYVFPFIFPTSASETENVVICVSGIGKNKPFQCLVSAIIPCHDVLEKTQCFPFYTYDEDGTNRQENIIDWALAQFVARYGDDVSKWDIFWYTYALLHHPTYRERYAENLRRDLPHIPLLGDKPTFHTLATLGKQLADLHLHYEQQPEYPLDSQENPNVPWTVRVERMSLTSDKSAVVVNESLTLLGIPPACFAYRLGNRSALEWVIDQYRVKEDTRSGIISDPNRNDDPAYLVRLVKQVVYVSVETVALVAQVAQVEIA